MDGNFAWWFVGFVDGEGCFDIHPVGEYFICRFRIGLRADDEAVLEYIRAQFGGIGAIRTQAMPAARRQARWEVARKSEVAVLADFFREYQPRSKKRRDWQIWDEAVVVWLAAQRGSRWHGRSPHTARLRDLRVALRQARSFNASGASVHS